MIVIEQAQFLPTVCYLSPWMQSAALVHVCLPIRPPLAASRCAGNSEWGWACQSVFVGLWKALSMLSCVGPLRSSSEEEVCWWHGLGRSSQQPSNNTVPHVGGWGLGGFNPVGCRASKGLGLGRRERGRKQQRGTRGSQGQCGCSLSNWMDVWEKGFNREEYG